MAKEVVIFAGREAGSSFGELCDITGLDSSSVSRRFDAAKQNIETDARLAYARELVERKYRERIASLKTVL